MLNNAAAKPSHISLPFSSSSRLEREKNEWMWITGKNRLKCGHLRLNWIFLLHQTRPGYHTRRCRVIQSRWCFKWEFPRTIMSTPLSSLCAIPTNSRFACSRCRTIVINSIKIAPNYTPLLIAVSSSLPVSSCHNRNNQKRAPNCIISPIFMFFCSHSFRSWNLYRQKANLKIKSFIHAIWTCHGGRAQGGKRN